MDEHDELVVALTPHIGYPRRWAPMLDIADLLERVLAEAGERR